MTDPVSPRPGGTILGRGSAEAPLADTDAGQVVESTFEELAREPVKRSSDTSVADPTVVSDEPATPADSAPRGAGRWSVAGCVVLALVALAFALFGLQQRSSRRAEQDQQSQLRDVSGRAVAALTNYDYHDLSAWKKSVDANAVGTFQSDFDSSYSGFAAAYTAEQNRGTGTVQGVWLGTASSGTATSVVLVQVTVTSLTGTHSVGPLFMQLNLLKVAGAWRVNQIAYFDSSTSGGTGGTTSTPTTQPGSGSTTPTSAP